MACLGIKNYFKQLMTWQYLKIKNENLLVPCVRFTRVLPICRVANIDGAFTSYQSFLVNGSTLKMNFNFINILRNIRVNECYFI